MRLSPSDLHPRQRPDVAPRLIHITVLMLMLLTVAYGEVTYGEDAQVEPDPPPVSDKPELYEFREKHDPNGIGKFYMEREIARVMGYGGISWLERPEREKEESLTKLVESLDLKEGDQVADIGAGSGVLSFRMSKKVGPNGKIWAVDIQTEMLEAINKKIEEQKVTNVEPLLCTVKETKLPAALIDLALFVDVYHELEFPYEVILDLSKKMKPGGRIVLVEYRKEDPDVPIKLVHKMLEGQVRKEFAFPEFRLKWKKTIDVLPLQHIIIFEKQP